MVPEALVKVNPWRAVDPETVSVVETVVVARFVAPWTVRYPVARRFVEETEASEDWPEMFKEAPWRKPEAERLVPEALVKFKVGKVP